jgi:hypothetical protein
VYEKENSMAKDKGKKKDKKNKVWWTYKTGHFLRG